MCNPAKKQKVLCRPCIHDRAVPHQGMPMALLALLTTHLPEARPHSPTHVSHTSTTHTITSHQSCPDAAPRARIGNTHHMLCAALCSAALPMSHTSTFDFPHATPISTGGG